MSNERPWLKKVWPENIMWVSNNYEWSIWYDKSDWHNAFHVKRLVPSENVTTLMDMEWKFDRSFGMYSEALEYAQEKSGERGRENWRYTQNPLR